MQPRKPWEYVEEILRTLRTAYPLLVVSMEGIVDSINTRFKCPWDEDSYRLIVALLNDGISVWPEFIYSLTLSTWDDLFRFLKQQKSTSSDSQTVDCRKRLRYSFIIFLDLIAARFRSRFCVPGGWSRVDVEDVRPQPP